MKITIYTTTSCQYSKQEKEYLASHSLQFEEKNLETNREYLTEMLTVGNNFAGTPVTKIEKDDGTIVVLKGFTQEEFDQNLGLAKPVVSTQAVTAAPPPAPTQSLQQPPQDTPTPQPPAPPMPEPTPPAPPTPMPPPPTPPPPTTPQPTPPSPANDPQLNALLNDLQSKSAAVPPTTPSSNLPNIPNPNF